VLCPDRFFIIATVRGVTKTPSFVCQCDNAALNIHPIK